MKYIKLFEELFNDDAKKKLSFNSTLFHYFEYGDLDDLSIPIFESDKEKWFFNQMLELIDELKDNNINTDDYKNVYNLGFKPNGGLAMFDLGFGDYFEHFEEDPASIELQENNTIIDRLLKTMNIPFSEFIGKGMFGFAHDIGDNKILKITKDKSEAVNSNKIKGKKLKHIANIYDVKQFIENEVTYYVIVLEKLRLDPTIETTYSSLEGLFEDARNENLPQSIIEEIGKKHKRVSEFLKDMILLGYKETWDKWRDPLEEEGLHDMYDFNEISDLSEWIYGSVTNFNDIDDEPPQYIIDILKKLL